MVGVRASDQDRDKAVEKIEDAYAKGQLNDAERELRTQKALQATTVDELQILVSDLGAGPVIPTHTQPVSFLRMFSSGKIIAVLVLAVVGLVIFGGIVLVGHIVSSIDSGTPTSSNPFPPAKDSAKDAKLLTHKGLSDLITSADKKFGSVVVSRAVIYPEYASFTVPLTDNSRHTQDWSFRGSWDKSIINGNRNEDDVLIDLGKVDVAALVGWVKKSQTELNVKNVSMTYLVFDDRDNKPAMSVYVSNEFNDLGYVSLNLDGTVINLYKYK